VYCGIVVVNLGISSDSYQWKSGFRIPKLLSTDSSVVDPNGLGSDLDLDPASHVPSDPDLALELSRIQIR